MRKAVPLLLLLGCGSIDQPGDSCVGGAECDSATSALFCQHAPGGTAGVFARFACPGANGCTSTGAQTVCDFSGVSAGDPCPASQDTLAVCKAGAQPPQFLQCLDGGWQGRTCSSCATGANNTVTCAP
jgi:hypothetical protein